MKARVLRLRLHHQPGSGVQRSSGAEAGFDFVNFVRGLVVPFWVAIGSSLTRQSLTQLSFRLCPSGYRADSYGQELDPDFCQFANGGLTL